MEVLKAKQTHNSEKEREDRLQSFIPDSDLIPS